MLELVGSEWHWELQDILKKFTGNSNLGDLMGQFSGENKSKDVGEVARGFFDKKNISR